MKAIICTKYGPPEVLELREVPRPAPKDNEVLIKVMASAVTPSDCIVRGFKLPMWHPMGLAMGVAVGFGKPRQPILGVVFAGEIDSVGKNVRSFRQGDGVFGWDLFPGFGAYAEYKCISEAGMLASRPANADYNQAAAIPYGGLLANYFLRKGNIQRGQEVLVYGASGAVGTIAVQLAKHFGANVTGVCSSANMELVRSLGAGAVIDYTREDFTKRGERYDLVFNAVGKRKAQLKPEQALAPNGKHITVDDGNPKVQVEDLVFLKELVEAGEIKPVIDRTYPLEQIAEAHRYVEQGHKRGNVIITVGTS